MAKGQNAKKEERKPKKRKDKKPYGGKALDSKKPKRLYTKWSPQPQSMHRGGTEMPRQL